MKKSDSLLFELSKPAVVVIFVYYIMLLLIGLGLSVFVLCDLSEEMELCEIINNTVTVSLSMSGVTCCLQYIKRLYKACITGRVIKCMTGLGQIGNIIYFVSRPLYAFVFSIISIYCLLSGLFIVTGNVDYIINEKFLYLCAIISSFIGYSVGHVLDRFETISQEQIEHIR